MNKPNFKLEKVAINGALPLKATRRDASCHFAKLKFFRGFTSELQTRPMAFHLDSLCAVTLVPLGAFAMDW